MPFPLAHPAAILPLRRYCPRWLSFPALVIGSLAPDAGYCFEEWHVAKFSHRFLAGSFGFCLPLGLLAVLLLYKLRRRLIQQLPVCERLVLEPFCARPPGPLLVIIISLLIGAWTHIFLDSFTHGNGWLVRQFDILRASVAIGHFQVPIYDFLYSSATLAGVAWLAWVYLDRIEHVAPTRARISPGFKWSAVLLVAALTLSLSLANHNLTSSFTLIGITGLSATMVAAFFSFTARALRPGPTPNPLLRQQSNAGQPEL